MPKARLPRPPRGAGKSAAGDWTRLSDAQLLQTRLCDLRLDIRHSPLATHLRQLQAELDERGIRLRPHVWLAEEWFSPDGVPGIAVPFYLAHPRLLRLERRMTHEVEGSNSRWLMRILRHEAGHAIDSAYRLRRRADWRALFGPASRPYRTQYRARPASREHVQHLGEWYAQSHPTEDFAETFAVWLAPRSDWRRRYASWPALRKLRLVQQMMQDIRGAPPSVRSRRHVESLAHNRSTLACYYQNKVERRRQRRGLLADRLLQRVFSTEAGPGAVAAAALLRQHKPQLLSWMSENTGIDRYGAHQVLRTAIERCSAQELYVHGSRPQAVRAARSVLVRLAARYLRSQGLRLRV